MSGFQLLGLSLSPVAFIDLGSPEDHTEEDFLAWQELHGSSDPIREFIDLSSPDHVMEEVFTFPSLTEEKIMVDDGLLDEYSSPAVTHPASTSQGDQYPSPNLSTSSPESPVEVLHPPPLELRHVWMADAANVLPHDILRRAPRRRGKAKWTSMEYEPCTREEYIARVNQRYKAPVAKRPRRQQPDEEGTKDPVVVALLAQAEIYGAASYFDWE